MSLENKKYLSATPIIDSDSKIIIDYAMSAIKDADDDPISVITSYSIHYTKLYD